MLHLEKPLYSSLRFMIKMSANYHDIPTILLYKFIFEKSALKTVEDVSLVLMGHQRHLTEIIPQHIE